MIRTYFLQWNFVRILRLVMGIVLCLEAFYGKDYLLVAFGLFFIFSALFNFMCCGSSCKIPSQK